MPWGSAGVPPPPPPPSRTNVVDWTVDKLLANVATLNARAEHARNIIRANRAAYMETLRAMANVSDPNTKAQLRAQLTAWIHRQVAIENQFNSFAAKWAAGKATVKRFLESVHIAPPGYLSALVLAPAAVWSLVAAALLLVALVITAAANHGKRLEALSQIVSLAVRDHWKPEAVATALREFNQAAAPPATDPLGIGNALKDALPLALLIGGLVIFGPMLKRRFA